MSEQLKASIGPLAQFFKRRSDFFENEAMSMAILLEQASQSVVAPTEPPAELIEDTTGNDPIEPYQPPNPPYVMAPEGASATPVEENEDGVSV